MDEEGVELEEIEKVAEYIYVKDENNMKKKRRMARRLGNKSLFYTSRWFLIYHLA
jgi:hypothetical protein